MSIYTGDTGETDCLDGRKLLKSSVVIHFLGAVDELNSHLGLVKALAKTDAAGILNSCQFIELIQKNLMKLMSHVSDCHNAVYFISDNDLNILEEETEKLAHNTAAAAGFVIPGKNVIEAQIHIARTAARRAERLFFTVVNDERALTPRQEDNLPVKTPLCPQAGCYLNRLSGYLFALSRQA